jgi:hypothetical protein
MGGFEGDDGQIGRGWGYLIHFDSGVLVQFISGYSIN